MPRVNIYIRNDDWEAWNNISDKPTWIHEGLTTGLVLIPAKSKHPDTPIPIPESFRGVGASVSGSKPEMPASTTTEQQPTAKERGCPHTNQSRSGLFCYDCGGKLKDG